MYGCGKKSPNQHMSARAQHWTKLLNIFGIEYPNAQVVRNYSDSLTGTYGFIIKLKNITCIQTIYMFMAWTLPMKI